MLRSRLVSLHAVLIVAAAIALTAAPAQAVVEWREWNGGSQVGQILDVCNWVSCWNPDADDNAKFCRAFPGGNCDQPYINGDNTHIGRIQMETGGYIFYGPGTLRLFNVYGQSIRIEAGSGQTRFEVSDLVIENDSQWQLLSGHELYISSAVNGDNNTISTTGGGTVELAGSTNNTSFTLNVGASGDLVELNKTNAVAVNTISGIASSATVKLMGTGGNQISGAVTVSGGTFDMNGKDETVTGLALTGSSITGGAASELTSTSAFDMQSGSADVVLAGGVGLAKTTGGTVTLSQASTYTGATTVSAGTLLVTGSLVSDVSVSGGLFGGGGTVGDLTLTGGTHAPGVSPGIDTVDNYNLGASATLEIEIDGTTVGTQYDQVDVTGTVDLAGTLDVVLGYAPEVGDAFMIIDNDAVDAVSGTFSGLAEGGTFSETYDSTDYEFKVYYAANNVGGLGDGNDVVLEVIPEPATLAVTGLGALALLARRRRRRPSH